jgi:hypothetical protein
MNGRAMESVEVRRDLPNGTCIAALADVADETLTGAQEISI